MWRRISASLTLRIFAITVVLLVAACALTYGALAYLTPITYTTLMKDELDVAAAELIARLAKMTPEDGLQELHRFSERTGASAMLYMRTEAAHAGDEIAQEASLDAPEETVVGDVVLEEATADDAALGKGKPVVDDTALEEAAVDNTVPGEEIVGGSALGISAVGDTVPEEATADDVDLGKGKSVVDDTALDEAAVGDAALGEAIMEDAVLDEVAVDDFVSGEAIVDDAALGKGKSVVDDTVLEEAAVDDTVPGEAIVGGSALGKSAVDDAVLDEVAVDNTVPGEAIVGSPALGVSAVDDSALGEAALDDFVPEEAAADDAVPGDVAVREVTLCGTAEWEADASLMLVEEFEETAFQVGDVMATQYRYPFQFRDGREAELVIDSGLRAVNRTTEAMGRVLPYLALGLLAFSLAGALIYARFITRPIVDISALAARIAGQDFTARWQGRRRDEIGALGESLNCISDSLSAALGELRTANDALRADIERERELERQRLAFFSATSHELKTPLTILKGQLTGMLAQVGAYRDREKYLSRALEVVGRMEGLVRQILTVSRVESCASVGDERVDLSALLLAQLEQDAELIEARGLTLTSDVAPGVVVRGSAKLLSSALDNILMNAIRYSDAGARVRVRLRPDALRVENSGAHIPEPDLPHIFEPFYRVEQSRNRASGGSGLGLYLVRKIFTLHGVACAIQNTPEGVQFEAKLRTKG